MQKRMKLKIIIELSIEKQNFQIMAIVRNR